jgi:hypothetical protein
MMEKLIEALKLRMQSTGETLQKDENDKQVCIKSDIFSPKQLKTALETSASMFNQFNICSTDIDEDADDLLETYQDLLVQGAAIQLLAGQALLEKGRCSSLPEILMEQWRFEYEMYMSKIRLLKQK